VESGLVQSPTLVANGQVDTSGCSWAGGVVIDTLCAQRGERVSTCLISTLKAGDVQTQSRVEYISQNGVRTLTPIECERLQGFPDNWTEGIPDNQRFKTCGNAVTVNVIEWIAKRIKEQDGTM